MQLLGVHEIATMSVAHEKGVTCEHYSCMFMSGMLWQERNTSIFFFNQSQELPSRIVSTVNLIVFREVRTMSVAHKNVISTLHCL